MNTSSSPVYLDYSANTPADPAVLQRFCETELAFPGNANSAHTAGRAARARMDALTASIAALLDVQPEEIIYTSGASEANNTAIFGLARANRHVGRHIISTPLEHPSVSGCLTALQEQGYEIDLLDIGRDGKLDLTQLQALLRPDTALVCITAVDSELGTIQPVRGVSDLLHHFPSCRLHVDATQAIGKIPFDFSCADTASFAPHKFYGLCGSGILYKRSGIVLEPLIRGGASTTLYRAGTPALGLAAAAELALQLAYDQFDARLQAVRAHNQALRQFFSTFPKVTVNSPPDAVPHILNLSVDGVRGADMQRALDEKAVCVSVKSACSVANTPSRAVFAVSRSRKTALCSFRVSLSHLTTQEDLSAFMERFTQCYQELTQ